MSSPSQLSPPTLELASVLHEGLQCTEMLDSVPAEEVIERLQEALEALRADRGTGGEEPTRSAVVDLLDAGRWPGFLRKVSGSPLADRWLASVLKAIDETGLTIGDLLRLRSLQRPERVQVQVPHREGIRALSRGELGTRVASVAAGLRYLLPPDPGRVPLAILAPNRLETMLVDLACLSYGIVNVPIAADATPEHVRFILEKVRPALFVVSDSRRLETVLTGGIPPSVRTIVLMDRPDGGMLDERCRFLADLEAEGRKLGISARPAVRSADLATILFTSGTTGRPKGIRFSQRSIVYKRFCRAVALPEIGEDDVFLCYLPLFHTFGRYLEMTGSLFWGARYTLMENPSREAVFRNMRCVRPSVFISIPKRWIQLHERIVQVAGARADDSASLDPARLRQAVEEVTGGRLRWGLSAAGHLDADIFAFFQRHGIELMSGFGMTEATGGITMTPPGRYRRGSVGLPLPGIEVRRAEDGELLVRGPYMMLGYDDDEETGTDFEHEWFATGDLFAVDPQGYLSIVDRKKDIYKNVKGQTIAPQRIENLFNEFEEIMRVFLVGDGREYNTLLIYPDYDTAGGRLRRMSQVELRDYVSSFVVSVNRFLAPYERVVDFDLLPRFFREDRGELTSKGTFIRKVVERNFADLIDALYARPYVSVQVQGIEVHVPNWFLREKGVTADALSVDPGGIRMRHTGERLVVKRSGVAPGHYRIGSCIYAFERDESPHDSPPVVDLDPLLRVPRFWVGNVELERFAGAALLRRPREGEIAFEQIARKSWVQPMILGHDLDDRFEVSRRRGERGPSAVHAAAALILTHRDEKAREALSVLERFLAESTSEEAVLSGDLLPLMRSHADPEIRRRALLLLLAGEPGRRAAGILASFLEEDPEILSAEIRDRLLDLEMSEEALRSILDLARAFDVGDRSLKAAGRCRQLEGLLRFVAELGIRHSGWFALARQVLVVRSMPRRDPEVAAVARGERARLERCFRSWIEEDRAGSIDPDTECALDWEEIIRFDRRVDPTVRDRLRTALRETTLLRESVFLLCDGALVAGSELLPGGIRVSYLGSGHGKTVVRVTVQTRLARSHEFVVKVMREIASETSAAEVDWMIRLGTRERAVRLVPEFGGFWPEHGLWTEEYLSNETVLAFIRRMTSREDPRRIRRLVVLWPHLAWSALSTFVEFWHRSGRSVVLSEPVPFNIVVAPHDYQEGSRLVSISSRVPFSDLAEMIRFLYEGFVESTEKAFPILRGGVGREIVFAAVIETFGEDTAIPLLWRALAEMREKMETETDPVWKDWHDELARYLEEIEHDGYAPRRLVMAVRRYHTWAGLNPGASLQARAMTLQELYETYTLHDFEAAHPEVRVRFFRMTVFQRARDPLATELDALIHAHRDAPLSLEALLRRMTILHRTCTPDEEETYFLARMSYSHLTPAQKGHLELLDDGGETTAELVEEVRHDEGGIIQIRAAASPKEVMRLHRLFEESGLSVVFRPEHRFLVGLDENRQVLGGLFYRLTDRATVHMEKIVVAPAHRGKGAGDRVMESFMQRMRDARKTRITTGFFRPNYFYRFGFRLERSFAGLVKDLRTSERLG